MRPTDQQQEIWLASSLSREASCSYNALFLVDLRGEVDKTALASALRLVVGRHDGLRTRFPAADRLVIEDAVAVPAKLMTVDLSGHAVGEWLLDQVNSPFDLADEVPLARFWLVRLGPREHRFVIVVHHVIADGWGAEVLIRDICSAYAGFCRAKNPSLPKPSRLAEHLAIRRTETASNGFDAARAYWRSVFASGVPDFRLPTDRRPHRVGSLAGGRVRMPLPNSLVTAVRKLAAAHDSTFFMAMFAAFQVLAGKLGGTTDTLIGTPFSNRRMPQEKELVAHCANLLAIRSGHLAPDIGFSTYLGFVQNDLLDAYEHGVYPMRRLIADIQPDRTTKRTGFVSTIFHMEKDARAVDFGDSLAATLVNPPLKRNATFDVIFSLVESRGSLSADVIYQEALYDRETALSWISCYQHLLESLVAGPDQPLSEISLLSAEEHHRILVDFNATTAPPLDQATVPELFAAQVQRNPDAIAIVCGAEEISFRELGERTDRLAAQLVYECGVRPDSVVAVSLPRTAEQLVVLLAVLKAGGAYLPLDPDDPCKRLRALVADAKAVLVITTSARRRDLLDEAPVLAIDAMPTDGPLVPAPMVALSPDNLAYLLYTSGSSGEPKGVAVTHRNVHRLVTGADYAPIGPGDRVLAATPMSFDASVFEVWVTLLHGGTCVLSTDTMPSVQSLSRVITDGRVDTAWLTASLFNRFMEQAPRVLQSLKRLITGGEALSPSHVKQALAELPGVDLVNGYGPTEAATFACCQAITRNAVNEPVSIGRPIAHTQAYILDHSLRVLPPGVLGELYLGGEGLARGYHNRPTLTAERFVANPFGRPGSRLYRTGDFASWRHDGTIDFRGRADQQVKIQGRRVEPGETEHVLTQHPAVAQALVATYEPCPAQLRLVAYLVPTVSGPVDDSVLHEYLAETLPPYLFPSYYSWLAELPLTANGKVDTRQLPAPRPDIPQEPPTAAASAERILCELIGDVLQCGPVGPDQNFFLLGGDSLAAIRLMARIHEELDVELPVSAVFETPTAADLAQWFT